MTWVLVAIAAVVVLIAAVAVVRSRRRRRARLLSAPRPTLPLPDVLAPTEEARPSLAAAEGSTMSSRLAASRGVFDRLRALSDRGRLADDQLEVVEEVLLRSDVGVATSQAIVSALRERGAPDGVAAATEAALHDALVRADRALRSTADEGRVATWLFVGVNGVGKTTSIGKVAHRMTQAGRTVVVAAGDTFRAAAADQLAQWAERTGAEIVRGAEGADPSSVIHDALARASARGADIVLADTAGRRHTNVNLLEELAKVRRVADRAPGQVLETLLVLDATTGQNALAQAREFLAAAQVTGVILTKLDGTARGGVVVAIERELGVPVKLVGLGEGAGDLEDFDPDEFVRALVAT